MYLGFITVGGKSTRMRRNKALLEWYQRPLFQHLATVLAPLCEDVFLLGRPIPEFEGYSVRPDAYAGLGPLAAVASALKEPGPEWRFILSCDTPFVDTGLLHQLTAGIAPGVDIVLPITADGRTHPLCGLWNCRVSAQLETHLEAFEHHTLPRTHLSVQRFVSMLRVAEISPADPRELCNINTMRDYLSAIAGREAPEN